jgi:hypothetical protein
VDVPGDIGSVGDPPSVGRTQRYGLLLVLTLLAFAIEGIAAPRTWVQVTLTVVLGSAVLVAFWAAEARHGVMRIVAAVVTLLVAFSIVEVATGSVDNAATRIAGGLLVALAPPAIVVGIVRSLRSRGAVTAQAVLGGICLYVLLGLFFAAVYGSIDKLAGEPFFAGGVAATVPHTVYFSFTTITTVGYGDYTAASNLGHTLSSSEALLGQIYLVTVVSLLVANLRPLRRRTE